MLHRAAIVYRTTPGAWGGGNSFLRALSATWQARGIDVSSQFRHDVDAVLLNSCYAGPGRELVPEHVAEWVRSGHSTPWTGRLLRSRWRDRRPPFVHRLDGVFRLYGRSASEAEDDKQAIINRFADWTIYQSEYCRQSFAAEGVDTTRSTVIHNGVETDRFRPHVGDGPADSLRLIATAWSPNPNKGAPRLARLSLERDVQVSFVGRWPKGVSPERVKLLGVMTHDELRHEYRHHDAFVHLAENDPCSNAVLEAMSAGLPVLYDASGGTAEIVQDCGVPAGDVIGESVGSLREQLTELRVRVIARRPQIDIGTASEKYLRVLTDLASGSVPPSRL